MSRLLLVVAVCLGVVLGLALWPSESEARKCTGPDFTCDAPEGCEMAAQMMSKWGFRAVFRDPQIRAQAKKAVSDPLIASGQTASKMGITQKEWDAMVDRKASKLLEDKAKEAAAKLGDKLPPCPKGKQPYVPPPGMQLVPAGLYEDRSACRLVARFHTAAVQSAMGQPYVNKFPKEAFEGDQMDVPTEDAKKIASAACEEMIDASLAHEQKHLDACRQRPKGVDLTLDQTADQEVDGYSTEIRTLRDAMAAVGQWCTPDEKSQAAFSKAAKDATLSLLGHDPKNAKKAAPKGSK